MMFWIFSLGMHEGLNTLRILFYANLLGGERDTVEIMETERENDQQMDVELVSGRQRQNDEGENEGNNDEQVHGEQVSEHQREGRSETAATTSPTRHRSTSFTMRTSTSESDEAESIYENPLQIKLNLEPNEYRHGHLPFDDFINEFANEKIEISKEYLDFFRQRLGRPRFSFILYPFFLSTINKIGTFPFFCSAILHCLSIFSALLNIENKVQMYQHRRSTLVHSIFSGIRLNPFFKLCVRRDHLIEDALIGVCYRASFSHEQAFFL